jgi:ribosome biogenesis GTPase
MGDGLAVLSGQSGVGKSTLLNKYFPNIEIETQHISHHPNLKRLVQYLH